KFMGDRPARRAADEAQPLLELKIIDLVDHAVDVIGEARALLADLAMEGEQRIDAAAELRQRVDGEAPGGEMLQRLLMRPGKGVALLAPGIGEEGEGPRGGDRPIELTQAARRGVARIGEDRLAGLLALGIEREEAGALHINLAAHLDHLGPAMTLELFRHAL